MTTNFQWIAWKLGVLLALCGVIWSCIQICFGTMEVRKFAVGIITKWFMYVICISMLPAVSMGIFKFATQVGNSASGTSVTVLEKTLSDYYKRIKKLAAKDIEDYDAAVEALKEARKGLEQEKAEIANSWRKYFYDDSFAEEMVNNWDKQLASWKESHRVFKILNSLEDILIIDDTNVTDSYHMDLELKIKDSNGNDAGLGVLSPGAYLKLAILCGDILFDHEWTDDVMRAWKENAGVDPDSEDSDTKFDNKWTVTKAGTFPLSKIVNIVLALLTSIMMVIMCVFMIVQYLMCIIEYSVTSTACLVLVPCILFDGTKDMANKILPTLFAQAMKLCMIIICMYFGLWVYMTMLNDILFNGGGISFRVFGYVCFLVVLTWALVLNAPKIAATIMTGSPQMSMGEFVQAAGAIAGGMAMAGRVGAGLTRAGAGMAAGGISFAGNRLGDLAEAGGAATRAADNAVKKGGGHGKQMLAALGGFSSNLASQTVDRLRSTGGNFLSKGTLNPVKAYRGAGGAGGGHGSGGGGAGFDRFNQAAKNSDGSRNYGLGKGANSPGANHSSDRKYGNAYGAGGEKTTYGDWLAARWHAGVGSGKGKVAEPKVPAKNDATPPGGGGGKRGGGNPPLPPAGGALALRGSGGNPPAGGALAQSPFGGGTSVFPVKFGSSFSPAALPDNRLSDAKKEIHNTRWGDKNSAEDAQLS